MPTKGKKKTSSRSKGKARAKGSSVTKRPKRKASASKAPKKKTAKRKASTSKAPKKRVAKRKAKAPKKKVAKRKTSASKAPKKRVAKRKTSASRTPTKKVARRKTSSVETPRGKAPAVSPDTRVSTGGDVGFEPRIVAFCCNWCSYPAADAAGISKMQYPPNARIIRVMCAGRIHPAFVLKALELGADGVLVSGCHFADCHYLFGAKRAAEQFEKTASLVKLLGLEEERVRFEQISAAEAPIFVRVMHEFVETLKEIGPSPLSGPVSGALEVPGSVADERT